MSISVSYTHLTIFLLIVLYPIIYVVSASFSDPKALMAGKVWLLPVNPTLEAYKATFQYERIWTGFGNSLIYAIVGTCLNTVSYTHLDVYKRQQFNRKYFHGAFYWQQYYRSTVLWRAGLEKR